MQDALRERAFVYKTLRQRLIAIHVQRFAGVQCLDGAGLQGMPHVYNSFFTFHQRGFIVVIHADVEGGSANGDHRGWSQDPVRIGLSHQMLDMYFHAAGQDIQ